jgi:hypothetical protein
VPAPGQAKKVAMLGSLDHVTRQLIVHTSPTKSSSDFIAHLEQDRSPGRIEQASSWRRVRRERPASPDRSPVRSSAMTTAVVKTAFAARGWLI